MIVYHFTMKTNTLHCYINNNVKYDFLKISLNIIPRSLIPTKIKTAAYLPSQPSGHLIKESQLITKYAAFNFPRFHTYYKSTTFPLFVTWPCAIRRQLVLITPALVISHPSRHVTKHCVTLAPWPFTKPNPQCQAFMHGVCIAVLE